MKKLLGRRRAAAILAALMCAVSINAQAQSYRYGDSSDQIALIQQALTDLNFYYADITGSFGAKTETAVKKFQKRYGLTQTGVADEATVRLISQLSGIEIATDGIVTSAGASFYTDGTTTLRYGMKTDAVRRLQEDLKSLDYYSGTVTGHYGTVTQEAVRRFQKKNGLTADGIAGPRTLAKLATLLGSGATGGTTSSGTTSSGATSSSGALLKQGSSGDAVRALQENLKTLGYYMGTVTGTYGNLTKEAVRQFQKKNGLAADGVAGERTLNKIYEVMSGHSGSGQTGGTTGTVTPGATAAPAGSDTMLQKGSSGDAVRALQENLKALGYYTGTITGTYGNLTKEAVRLFQRDYDLGADGVAGPRTLAKIAEAIAAKSGSATASPAPSGTPAPGATPAPTPAAGALDTTKTLRYGNSSEDVRKLQTALTTLGYFSGTATGYYGTQTTAAVKAYQAAKGLTADGIAGKKTLAAINADLANGTAATAVLAASVRARNVLNEDFYGWRTRYANGEHCTVYDFETGASWTLRIMTKDAHMDAEPLTKQDTAAMTKAFGGKQDWTRKAVWVTFSDGKTYIAATASAPHGTQHITTNDFKGHLCVHFPISMTRAEGIGPNAVAFQKKIEEGWAATQKM